MLKSKGPLILLFLALIGFNNLYAQQGSGKIKGWVQNSSAEPLAGITIKLKDSTRGTATDTDGHFILDDLEPREYTLTISGIGFVSSEQKVSVGEEEVKSIRITLDEDNLQLDGVIISGKSDTKIKREEAFNVASISTKEILNSSNNLDEVLNTQPGIHIRKEGGLGSRFNLSLNGLSGRQVRFYIDGLPIENYGSTFGINNIPANLIERVEVYKGVVPVYLGGDALGGAVNLVTRQSPNYYLDASISTGSFNTRKLALDGQYVDSSSGFVLKANGFYNYSDNNYNVDVRIPDPETGTYGEEQEISRFHDAYESRMVKVEAGFRDLGFADEIMAGLSLADNYDEVQHGVSMDRVFGRVYTTGSTELGSFTYRKSFHNLNIKAFASYLNGNSGVVDTSTVSYNWLGEFKPKNNSNIAEAGWDKTLFQYNDKAFQSSVNLAYQPHERHELALNFSQNYIKREGSDPASTSPVAFADPNTLHKKVIAGSYKINLLQERLSATIFSKLYLFNSNTVDVNWDGEATEFYSDLLKPGYGIASTYHLLDGLQVKASYEKTYRFPDGYELFGDGLLLLSNPQLSPENSHNINVGARFDQYFDNHYLAAETNYFRRNAEDLIRIEAAGLTSQYVNQRAVISSGIEAGLRYEFKRLFFADLNLNYQNIVNNSRFENGRISHVYGDRIPNIPYLMSTQGAGLKFDDFVAAGDRFTLTWRGNFVEKYFLKWPSLGSADSKHIIPRQYIHHAQAGYSLKNGRYNISFEVFNLMDAKAYDHFRLQKPGRSFQLKLRYLFN